MSENFKVIQKVEQVTQITNRVRFPYNYEGPELGLARRFLYHDGSDDEYVYYSDFGNENAFNLFEYELEKRGLIEGKRVKRNMRPCAWWGCDGLVDSDNYCILCKRGQG